MFGLPTIVPLPFQYNEISRGNGNFMQIIYTNKSAVPGKVGGCLTLAVCPRSMNPVWGYSVNTLCELACVCASSVSRIRYIYFRPCLSKVTLTFWFCGHYVKVKIRHQNYMVDRHKPKAQCHHPWASCWLVGWLVGWLLD